MQCRTPDTDRFSRYEDALGVHAVKNGTKAVSLSENAIGRRNAQSVKEQFIGVDRVAAHLFYRAHAHARPVEIRIKNREPLGPALYRVERSGAGEHQHLVCDLRCRDPDFLPRKDVIIPFPVRAQLDRGGIETCIGFGHGKAGLVLAGNQRRQHAAFLLIAAKKDDRLQAEDVHVNRRCSAHSGTGSAMACIMSAASVMPRPEPPYSAGMAMPSHPAAASDA